MTAYGITLKGCDGETFVTADLTDGEIALLSGIAAATQAESQYDCQPVMTIRPYVPADWDEVPRSA
jgi:hypothetical protein